MQIQRFIRWYKCLKMGKQDHSVAAKPYEEFHTENRKPHEVPSWVIIKGRCERCHKEFSCK